VFWYIVLQDVILWDERNRAVLNLAPPQMILVEKLWVLGPEKVLAQVVYPAKGYVPLTSSTLGQLITRLDPFGASVPKEVLEIRKQKTNKTAVHENPSNYCLLNHKEYWLSPKELLAFNQGCRSYEVAGVIPPSYSYPILGNEHVGWPRVHPENLNQSTFFQSYGLCNCPGEWPARLQQVHKPQEYLAVDSCKACNQNTNDVINGSIVRDPAVVAQEPGMGGLSSAHPHCSCPNQRRLRSLSVEYHSKTNDHNSEDNKDDKFRYGDLQTQGFINFCRQCNQYFINSAAKSKSVVDLNEKKSNMFRTALQCRMSLIKRLVSIYHSGERYNKKDSGKDIEGVKELENAVPADGISHIKPNHEKSAMAPLCRYRRQWRYDIDRWITVSALCHALQVICNKNKRRVKSNNLRPIMIFHSANVPDISLPAYLERISWFLGCSSACFVFALEYINRLEQQCPEIEVNDNSVHQIVITCIMVATKFIDDKLFKNTFYARVAGLPVINLSAFEVQLVFFLKFDLRVLPDQYNARYEAMLADNQGPSAVHIRPEGIKLEANKAGLIESKQSS
jgi:hypothetical protein